MGKNAKLSKIFLLVICLIVSASLIYYYAQDSNVTQAPAFMPGFPMIAGENVMIMWVPVHSAVKYKIYQNGEIIGEVPAPPFKYPAPKKEGKYKYTITGVDENADEGPMSNEGVISILKLIQPETFAYTFIDDLLNITWSVVLDAVIYDVYRAKKPEGPYSLLISTTKDRYVDTEIKRSKKFEQTFYYKIVSRNMFNKSSPDDQYYEVRVSRIVKKETDSFPSLKIMRSKEVSFVKPDILSCFDADFLSDGKSLVCVDTFSQKIIVTDISGKTIRTIGEAGIRPDQYKEPIRIAVDEDDNIYVLDNKKPRMFAYDSKGELIYSKKVHTIDEQEIIDHYYSDIIQIKEPLVPKLNAIAVNGDFIYAADKMTGTIQIYNKEDGLFVNYYKNKKDGEIGYFGFVSNMLISKDGKLYLAKPFDRKISVIDFYTGEYFNYIGRSKDLIGAFISVNSMSFDKNDDLIASDGAMHTVQVFSKNDSLYMYHIGDEKAAPNMRAQAQKSKINLDFPGPVSVDAKKRFWIYLGRDKGFSVREYVGVNPWDAENDKPEL